MVFMNYILSLSLTKKSLQLQFLRDWQDENEAFRDQTFHIKIYFHHPLHHIPLLKGQKGFFFTAYQPLRVLKLLRVLINRVFLRFPIDRSLYMFLSDRVLLRVFSDRELQESSVIGSSSRPSVIDYSLGSLVLFFWYAAIF